MSFLGFCLDIESDNLSNVVMRRKFDVYHGSKPSLTEAKCPETGYFFGKQEPFLRAFFLGAFAPLEGQWYYGECPDAGHVF